MAEKVNYYKYSTYALILVLILGGILYSHISIKNQAYERGIMFGQENAVTIILNEISSEGEITIETGSGNVTLIPLVSYTNGLIDYTNSIIETAQEQGYVTLRTNEREVSLLRLDSIIE